MLRYGLGELTDLYRDEWTIRQVWVRIKALPPEAPLWDSLRDERERAEAERRAAEVDDALTRYRKG